MERENVTNNKKFNDPNFHLFSNVDVNAISDPTESDHEENTNKFERIDVELETNRLWIENGAH